MEDDSKELKNALYRQITRFEDIGLQSLMSRRSFIITVFTITAASLGGLLVVDLKVDLNTMSFLGLVLLCLNLFIIPIYFWLTSTKEISTLISRIDLLGCVYARPDLKATLNESAEFKKLFDNSDKNNKRDITFDLIVLLFVLGLLIFVISISPI